MDLYPFFDWLDTSLLADISKAYGSVFAVVQMFHLLGISLLGGMVLLGDLRLLNLVMKDIPSRDRHRKHLQMVQRCPGDGGCEWRIYEFRRSPKAVLQQHVLGENGQPRRWGIFCLRHSPTVIKIRSRNN